MDWKYKHFERTALLPAGRDAALEAARAFAAEALVGWQVSPVPDGLEARGHSGGHAATAKFTIEPAEGGTRVAVTLLVERASPLGFILWDIGFYDAQMRRWLEGIQVFLHPGTQGGSQEESAARRKQAVAGSQRPEKLLMGCILAGLLLASAVYCITALVGLVSGNLYLPGRGGGGVTLHGPWARIASGSILLALAWFLMRVFRKTRPRNRGEWLPGK